jgi:K+-sensing histidine kinase KdpD
MPINFQPIELSSLVSQICWVLSDEARDKRVKLKNRAADVLLSVNQPVLVPVLMNLIYDAIKHSQPGGIVTISVVEGSQEVEVAVSYSGAGRHVSRFANLFSSREPEADAELLDFRLSMELCSTMLSQHGGALGVRDEPGIGSTLWFSLPVTNLVAPTVPV